MYIKRQIPKYSNQNRNSGITTFFNFARVKFLGRGSRTSLYYYYYYYCYYYSFASVRKIKYQKKRGKKLRYQIDFSTKGDNSTRSDGKILIEEQEVIMQFLLKTKRV